MSDPQQQPYVPFEGDEYRPVPWRRKLLILLLAVMTAISLLGYMLGRRGDIIRTAPHVTSAASAASAASTAVDVASAPATTPAPTPDVPRCKPGQTTGCVGGMATVIVAPPASSGR